jgi:MFS family permease
VDLVVDDIKEAIQRDTEAEKAVGWGVIWHPTPAFKRMLWVGIGAAVAQQAVGIDAIQYFLLDILEKSGVESQSSQTLILIFLGLVKLFFVYVGGKLFDRRGRRPLIFVSLIGKLLL